MGRKHGVDGGGGRLLVARKGVWICEGVQENPPKMVQSKGLCVCSIGWKWMGAADRWMLMGEREETTNLIYAEDVWISVGAGQAFGAALPSFSSSSASLLLPRRSALLLCRLIALRWRLDRPSAVQPGVLVLGLLLRWFQDLCD
jgi:hypothetical protein